MTVADRRFVGLLIAFAALCAPLIHSSTPSNYSMDEAEFHLPAIRQIRSHWPRLDFQRDTLSAISPAYHYLLATGSFVYGVRTPVLRWVNWGVSAGVLVLLWRAIRCSLSEPALWLAPLAASNFFVKSASWVVTDNAGLIAATAVLCAALPATRIASAAEVGVLSAIATALRQLHAWTAATTAAVAFTARPRKKGDMAYVLLTGAVLALLFWQWHGLVPPTWRGAVKVEGVSLAAVSYALSVWFILGIFYWSAGSPRPLRHALFDRWTLFGAFIGLGCALQSPTNFDMDEGRWGGYLWNCAAHLPAWHQRSALFVVLAPLGGALAAAMSRTLRDTAGSAVAAVWTVSLVAWGSTFVVNRLGFHRYFEPLILVFLILWVARVTRPADKMRQPGVLWLLTAGQLCLTGATAHWQALGIAAASSSLR